MNACDSQAVNEWIMKADAAIQALLKTDKDKEKLLADLTQMIRHQIDLTDKVESRRVQANQFALQTLALCFTGIGVLVATARGNYPAVIQGVIVFLSLYALTALVISFVFERQSSFRYPFLSLQRHGNSWKWFYYGNPRVQELSTAIPLRRRKGASDATLECQKFLASLVFFTECYTKETLDSAVVDALRQFHLLQAHSYYKNKFYLKLSNIHRKGTTLAILGALLAILVAVLGFGILPTSASPSPPTGQHNPTQETRVSGAESPRPAS
jgi:hypothetical protein